MRWLCLAAFVGMGLGSGSEAAADFEYLPAGDLIPGSGEGAADETVYAPAMRFPIEEGPAYPNSQVYMNGGGLGPGGGQCDDVNYSYPWRDNYCESRSWDMPLCPAGVGHQGQDIRPPTCDPDIHWTVAAEAGTITNVGSFSVYITTPDGTRYDYLHGSNVSVSLGEEVTKEQRINTVSNEFGGTPTTWHLHFNIRQDVAGLGFVFVNPYMSLVRSYERLLGLTANPPTGVFDGGDCSAIIGWAQDEQDPDRPVEVRLAFDGPIDDVAATVVSVTADQSRDDLCAELGSCEHAFAVEVPRSVRDREPHSIHVYGVDADDVPHELDLSPQVLQCAPLSIPDGVRRAVSGPDAMAGWGLSPFWDVQPVEAADVEAVPEGGPWLDAPDLVSGDGALWVLDRDRRRRVPDDGGWDLDASAARDLSDAEIEIIPIGAPLRNEPFLIQSDPAGLFVVDAAPCSDGVACDPDPGGSGGAETGGDATLPPGSGQDGDGDGCGCRPADPAPAPWLWLLCLVVARRRTHGRRSA